VSAGSVTIVSTVGNIRKLKVSGLTVGQSATVTQRNFLNSAYQTGTVSATVTAPQQSSGGGGAVAAPIPVVQLPVAKQSKVLRVTGFRPGSSVLTASMKNAISKFAKTSSAISDVSCVGYTMGPTILRVDQALARKRAQNVCAYLAKANPAAAKLSSKSVTTKFNSGLYRRTLVTITF
jgi:outer membrane protein OmpA-like peptidoglycan-associated protein